MKEKILELLCEYIATTSSECVFQALDELLNWILRNVCNISKKKAKKIRQQLASIISVSILILIIIIIHIESS